MKIQDRFHELLIAANDETVDEREHNRRVDFLYAWKQGVHDARKSAGLLEIYLNGDYHYIDLGVDRPMCVGLFLDWKQSVPSAGEAK